MSKKNVSKASSAVSTIAKNEVKDMKEKALLDYLLDEEEGAEEAGHEEAKDESSLDYLTYLSLCIQDVYTTEERPKEAFAARVDRAKSRSKDARLTADETAEVESLISMIGQSENEESTRVRQSGLGIRLLLTATSKERLGAYCELLRLTKEDLSEIFSPDGSIKLAKHTMAMAMGIYCQNVREREAQGLFCSNEDLALVAGAFAALDGCESFWDGAAFTKRLVTGDKAEKKRGRRFARYGSKAFVLGISGKKEDASSDARAA